MLNTTTCPIGVNAGRDSDHECGQPTVAWKVIGTDSDAELVRVCDLHSDGRRAPLWVREFGAEYDVPAAIYTALFDLSWHNDVAPRFGHYDDSDTEVVIWVEHPDQQQRESGSEKRFNVEYRDFVTDPVTILSTDDVDEALAAYHLKVSEVLS